MKPIYTLGMLALLSGLGVYIFYFEQDSQILQEPIKTQGQIISFVPSDLKGLTLKKGGVTLVVKRFGKNDWALESPVKKPADRFKVEAVINQLKDWKAKETLLDSVPPNQKKDFGLAQASFTLALDLGASQQVILLGSRSPMNLGYYAMVQGKPKLFLSYTNVPESLERWLAAPPVAPSLQVIPSVQASPQK